MLESLGSAADLGVACPTAVREIMTDAAEPQPTQRVPGVNRRGFVGAAAVGVGAAWVAPAVISMPANGSSNLVNSPPPTTTTTTTSSTTTSTSTSTTTSTSTPTTPTTGSTTTTTRPDDGQLPDDDDQGFPDDDGRQPGSGNLPRTGFDLQDPLTVAFGLIAAGGAMQVWSAQRERLEAAAIPVDPAADGGSPPVAEA
jgi:hypothetical protein